MGRVLRARCAGPPRLRPDRLLRERGEGAAMRTASDCLLPPWSAQDRADELTQLLARRLAENVVAGPADECWEWRGARSGARYGVFKFASKALVAHRVALEFVIGRPLETGEMACHRCDNPPCCNPAHLYVGNAEENRADAAERFRGPNNSPDPTAQQLRILQFICDCRMRFGFPPSIREIGAAFGIASTNGVNDHLKALERKGLIAPRSYHTARALVPTEAGLAAVKARASHPPPTDLPTAEVAP